MHKHILTQTQTELLPFVKQFSRNYYLVGDTAIALQIGHRRSIDFDLFTSGKINKNHINKLIRENKLKLQVRYEDGDQLTGSIKDVQFTWIEYPYKIPATKKLTGIIKMPDLLTLAAMKSFALGRRAKWKDYVDLYFILNNHHSLKQIANQAIKLYSTLFNEKLLRQQLCFFDDIDYTETVEYVINPIKDELIKKSLTKIATEKL